MKTVVSRKTWPNRLNQFWIHKDGIWSRDRYRYAQTLAFHRNRWIWLPRIYNGVYPYRVMNNKTLPEVGLKFYASRKRGLRC